MPRVDKEIYVVLCVHCDEEIDELEAHKHMFIIGGYAVYFHARCCPIILGEQECKASHFS